MERAGLRVEGYLIDFSGQALTSPIQSGPTTEASMGRKRGPDYRACGLALALDDRRHAGSAMSTVGGSVSE